MSHRQVSSDIVRKREALEELLQSDGWQYFVAYVRNEWQGVVYAQRIGTALANESKDPHGPHVVHRTSQELVRLLDWPKNAVVELKGFAE